MKTKPNLRVLTNSERSSAACDRRWGYAYDLRLTPKHTPAPLRQGTLWHLCTAGLDEGLSLVAIEEQIILPWLQKRADERREYRPESGENEYDEDMDIVTQTRGMLSGYQRTYQDRDVEILGIECQIAADMRTPAGRPIYTRPDRDAPFQTWVYGASLDKVVVIDGDLWLWERKTTVDKDLLQYCRKLNLDAQIRGYLYALKNPRRDLTDPRLYAALEALGFPTPVGVIYDVARKAVPRTPPLLKDGKSVSRAAIDTTWEIYKATVESHGFNPADYEDMREKLVGNQYFHREYFMITPRETKVWADEMALWAKEIGRIEKIPQGQRLRQLSLCEQFHRPCPFVSLCIEDGQSARDNFRVRTSRHQELNGDLAQSSSVLPVGPKDIEAMADLTAQEPEPLDDDPFADIRTNDDPFDENRWSLHESQNT